MRHQPKNAPQPPLIKLYDLAGTALIIEWPSGVRYSNQTMGTACAQPQCEGVLLPLGNELPPIGAHYPLEKKLFDYFTGPAYRGSGAMHGLTVADAEKIDAMLQSEHAFKHIKVDRARLRDSHEAWVRVLIYNGNETYPLFTNFGPFPIRAVLTWSNSD